MAGYFISGIQQIGVGTVDFRKSWDWFIEFVETERIPVAKKLGWYIDMKKRNPEKVLPRFLFKLIGIVSREKVSEA